jgi:large subunit ribosomal protein L9
MLLRPLGEGTAFEFMARGWAIVLVSMFGIACLLGGRRLFLSRALSAVAATFVFAGAVVLVSKVEPGRVHQTLTSELDRRAAPLNAQLQATTTAPEWQSFVESNPRFAAMVEQMLQTWNDMPDVTVSFFPALLALESLAALALAWGLFHRISRTRVGPPLSRLRDFRFGDQLVWGLLVGIVLVVIPTLGALRGLGVNLIAFFGALYVLRGLGVLAWFIAERRLALAILILLAVVFTPAVGVLALGLGLGDTWIDWRGRARQQTDITFPFGVELMEVILRQSVEKLGHPGDVVKVSNGFARNYLLPRGIAVVATEGNKKQIEAQRQRLEAAEDARRETAQSQASVFEQVSLTFSARVGEEGKLFGSVTSSDIVQQLEALGHKVEKRRWISTSRSRRLACIACRSVSTRT